MVRGQILIHILIHTHTYSYILIHTHRYSYILIYTHTYSYIYIYIYIYTYICLCLCRYDASFPVPPTYTFLKREGYWSITAMFCILNQVVLYGITTFVCIASLIFSIYYEDPNKVFDWDCLFDEDDDGWTRRTSSPTLSPNYMGLT